MIDYLKLLIIEPDIQRILTHPLLDFKREFSESTGELSTFTTAHYHHCKITVYDSGTVLFSGSIHKLYNSLTGIVAPNFSEEKEYRGFNGNQFYYHELDFVRKNLVNLFGVPSENMIIKNIEIGTNLTTYFNPQIFLTGLLLFEGKPFEYRYNDYYTQSVHQQYIIKIYNKGHQYDMAIETLRFEVKITTMDFLKKKVQIHSLKDITPNSIGKALKYLKELMSKVLYYDNTIDETCLNSRQIAKCKDYNNPRYWLKLKSTRRDRPKKNLKSIIESNSDNLLLELLSQFNENCVKFNRYSKTRKCVIFKHSSIVSNITHSKPKLCPFTNYDISMQKPDSTMLSNTGLKYLENYNPKAFEKLKRTLLTGKENKYEKDIYSMMSKQIRNRKNSRPPDNPNQLLLM